MTLQIGKQIAAGTAALALAATSAAPAQARDGDGIGAGEVIAGAVILGGLAAIIAASSDDDDDRYDYRGGRYERDNRYSRGGYYGQNYGGSRQAVQQCVSSAENGLSYRGSRANVTDVSDIDRTRYGYRIKGRIVVQDYGRGYRDRDYDKGKFTCIVDRGRVVDMDYSGIKRDNRYGYYRR